MRKGSEDSSRSDSVFTDEASIRESSDSDFTKSAVAIDIFNDVTDSPRRSPARSLSRMSANQSTPPAPQSPAPEVEKPPTATTPTKPNSRKPSSKKAGKNCSRKGSKIKSKDTSTTAAGVGSKRPKRKIIDVNKNVDAVEGEIPVERDDTFDSFRCLILPDGTGDESEQFTKESDICAACGSIGDANHLESKMIFCANCAQSYHIYCSGIPKLTKTVLDKGWLCKQCDCCELCDEQVHPTDGGTIRKCLECSKTYHNSCLTAIPVSGFTKNPLEGMR